jgi:hypothetical protein
MATVFPSQGAEMSFEHERYPIYTQDDSLDDVIKDQQHNGLSKRDQRNEECDDTA